MYYFSSVKSRPNTNNTLEHSVWSKSFEPGWFLLKGLCRGCGRGRHPVGPLLQCTSQQQLESPPLFSNTVSPVSALLLSPLPLQREVHLHHLPVPTLGLMGQPLLSSSQRVTHVCLLKWKTRIFMTVLHFELFESTFVHQS